MARNLRFAALLFCCSSARWSRAALGATTRIRTTIQAPLSILVRFGSGTSPLPYDDGRGSVCPISVARLDPPAGLVKTGAVAHQMNVIARPASTRSNSTFR